LSPVLVWALSASVIILALGIASTLVILALRFRHHQPLQQDNVKQQRQEEDLAKVFNQELTRLRSQRFGMSMQHPHRRNDPTHKT
jgi:hypothetical protein